MLDKLILCLSAILPLLLVVAIGYAAKRAGLIREQDVPRANKWAFSVFMPLMCFYNIYSSDLSSALRPELIVFTVCAILAVYALSLLYAVRAVKRRESRSSVIQGLFRSNYVILGLPLAAGLSADGDIAVAAVLGAVVVPIFNALAVVTLEVYNGRRPDGKKLLLSILRNPLILGSLAGIFFLAAGLRLPEILEKPVRDLGKAASPLMLFLLGAFFHFKGRGGARSYLTAVCLGRLLLIPALTLGCAAALGFRGIELISLLAVFASPTAVASFTMAEQMGADAELAGSIVVTTSFLSAFTLFGWSFLLKMLNFI